MTRECLTSFSQQVFKKIFKCSNLKSLLKVFNVFQFSISVFSYLHLSSHFYLFYKWGCKRIFLWSSIDYQYLFFVNELLEVAASIELVSSCVYVFVRTSKDACRYCSTEWSCSEGGDVEQVARTSIIILCLCDWLAYNLLTLTPLYYRTNILVIIFFSQDYWFELSIY